MTYSGGGSKGNPVIHLGPVAIGGELEKYEELLRFMEKDLQSKRQMYSGIINQKLRAGILTIYKYFFKISEFFLYESLNCDNLLM